MMTEIYVCVNCTKNSFCFAFLLFAIFFQFGDWNFVVQHCNILKSLFFSLKVTVLQVVRSPVIPENVSFVLDPSLSNVTVYINGDSAVFTLYSPTGEPKNLKHGLLT